MAFFSLPLRLKNTYGYLVLFLRHVRGERNSTVGLFEMNVSSKLETKELFENLSEAEKRTNTL